MPSPNEIMFSAMERHVDQDFIDDIIDLAEKRKLNHKWLCCSLALLIGSEISRTADSEEHGKDIANMFCRFTQFVVKAGMQNRDDLD